MVLVSMTHILQVGVCVCVCVSECEETTYHAIQYNVVRLSPPPSIPRRNRAVFHLLDHIRDSVYRTQPCLLITIGWSCLCVCHVMSSSHKKNGGVRNPVSNCFIFNTSRTPFSHSISPPLPLSVQLTPHDGWRPSTNEKYETRELTLTLDMDEMPMHWILVFLKTDSKHFCVALIFTGFVLPTTILIDSISLSLSLSLLKSHTHTKNTVRMKLQTRCADSSLYSNLRSVRRSRAQVAAS